MPALGEWVYYRIYFDFTNKKVQVFVGTSLDNLKPWNDSYQSYMMQVSATASVNNNLAKVRMYQTTFDDLKIYNNATTPISAPPFGWSVLKKCWWIG